MEHRKKVMVQCIVTVSVEKVWKFWTEPRHIKNWNVASDEWICPDATNDLRENGAFSYTMSSKDGKNSFDFKGTYIDIIPEKLLKYEIEDGRIVTVVFSEQGTETEIIQAFEAEDNHTVEQQQAGWNAILQNFKNYCEDPETDE
ncbi:SRPBCC domain-containing protein [Flavobacterium sp. SM2513]|uniref:SRPBCC domain-containing protein n=1 Tax=Flavobacterium sp. SM2513 TaxID=3424766 RepID=UPI003D7FC318